MNTTKLGPPRCSEAGQKYVRDDRQGALYRLPPSLRILPEQAASATKRWIVAGAARGIIPARVAEAMIRYGGLRHA